MAPLAGKIVVVTGANSGIGFHACQSFAEKGAHVVMICRNQEKGGAARDVIRRKSGNAKIDLLLADFASLADIRKLAETLIASYDKINVLCNNAGRVVPSRIVNDQGYEETITVNHLSPFLLTHLIVDHFAANARIIFTSSRAHFNGPIDFTDFQGIQQKYNLIKAYGRSKLMNLLTAQEMHHRLGCQGLKFSSFHPGVIKTDLWNKGGLAVKIFGAIGTLFMRTPQQGADTLIWLASSEDAIAENPDGGYFYARKQSPVADYVTPESAKALYEVSCALTGI